MAENKHDKGCRRIPHDRRNFLDRLRRHVAAPWTGRVKEEDPELVDELKKRLGKGLQ
jgi:hypothetical protein